MGNEDTDTYIVPNGFYNYNYIYIYIYIYIESYIQIADINGPRNK